LKRLDLLIAKELYGPWLVGVGLFTALLMAGTYLGRLAGYIVDGIPLGTILRVMALLLPAILVQTFAMAMLLAGLLGFGRLSSDSEIVALRAAGISLVRIIAPVALFSALVAALAFAFNEKIVPSAAKASEALTDELARKIGQSNGEPRALPEYDRGKLVAFVTAKDFDLMSRTMIGVAVVTYGTDGKPEYALTADQLTYNGPDDWRIKGNAQIVSFDGTYAANLFGGVWPQQIPAITLTPEDIQAPELKSFERYSMEEMLTEIQKAANNRWMAPKDIANLEYGYWNKIALPLAAVVFGVLGAALGIRSHRAGTAAGFALAIAIIFCYFMLANFMNVWAMGGIFPPYVASFAPIVAGLVVCGVIIWRRNR